MTLTKILTTADLNKVDEAGEVVMVQAPSPDLSAQMARIGVDAINEFFESLPQRKMPAQKPGKSNQDVGTPADFMNAVTNRFGTMDFDLAADPDNRKALRYFSVEEDSLVQNWNKIQAKRLWLNPPFARIGPWAEKCLAYVGPGTIHMLVPAAVGSRWFEAFVFKKAHVTFFGPRISFDGIAPYPKDCMLVRYGQNGAPGFAFWDWRTDIMQEGFLK